MKRINNIEDIFILRNGIVDIGQTIGNISIKSVYVPNWQTIAQQYYPYNHKIIKDPSARPAPIVCDDGSIERPARIPIPSEQTTVREFVQMALTNPAIRTYDTANENGEIDEIKEAQRLALEAVYKEIRIDGINNKRLGAWAASCEFVTIPYVQRVGPHNEYGFNTEWKIRSRTYSPMPEKDSGVTQGGLYPIFDRFDNLIAIGIQYTYTILNSDLKTDSIEYFELHTDTKHYVWVNEGSEWQEEAIYDIPIGKISGVYCRRSAPIWAGIEDFRNEYEFAISQESDNLRKNGKPLMILSGKILDGSNQPRGDYTREYFQVENGGDVKLIAPTITYEASRSYTDELKQNIREVTQMADLTAKAIAGSGLVSGTARETLLMNPTLRVLQETQEFLVALDRECNIFKSWLGFLNPEWMDSIMDLKVTHEINTYRFNDRSQRIIDAATALASGAMSLDTAIKLIDEVNSIEEEKRKIEEDQIRIMEIQNNIDRLSI